MHKILFIASTLRRGGPTNQLYNLIKYLDRSVFDPNVLTLSPDPVDNRGEDFSELGISINTLGLSRGQGIYSAYYAVRKYVHSICPDLIHTQGVRSDSILAHMKVSAGKVCTLRCNPALDYKLTYGRIVGTIMAYWHYSMLRKIPNVITCSKSLSLQNVSHNIRSKYVLNGIDLDMYRDLPFDNMRNEIRNRLNIDKDHKVYITTGHLNVGKRPEDIISAMNICRINNAILLLVGDGALRESLQKKYAENKLVKFIGRVSDVRPYLAASDVFVSASSTEGLPNAVIEALAFGLPAILSDIAPHREILEINPEAGILFATREVYALAQAIQSPFSERKGRVAARNIVERQLNARTMSKGYQDIYNQILDRRRIGGHV